MKDENSEENSSDFLGLLEEIVELMKQGFITTENPILSLILENMKELMLTTSSIISEHEYLFLNERLEESKILSDPRDPLIYERDELGNPKSIKVRIKPTIVSKPDLERLEEFLWFIYESLLRFQRNPKAQFLVERQETSKSTHLGRNEYWYRKRKKNAHKNSRKETP